MEVVIVLVGGLLCHAAPPLAAHNAQSADQRALSLSHCAQALPRNAEVCLCAPPCSGVDYRGAR